MAGEEWTPVRLGDLVEIKHGWPFKSEYFDEELTGRPIVISVGNFRYTGGFRFSETAVKEYRDNYPKEYELSSGDILLIMTCQTAGGEILGIPAKVPNDGRVYLHNQRLGKVVIRDRTSIDPDYLYWLFLWYDFNRELVASASGTKILHTAPSRIEAFRFHLPPIDEQRAIAHILDTLDNKIELNRRMNETLEAMALALFQSWFADFDPVKAKVEGRECNLPKSLNNLFPNSFENSELGEIPKGWTVVRLGDPDFFPLVTPGVSIDAATYVSYIATGDVKRDQIEAESQGTMDSLPSRANMQPGYGRVWFAKMKDSRKYLWTMLEDQDWWSSRVLSTGFAGLQAKSTAYESLLYCFIAGAGFDHVKNNLATGTTMQAINNDTIGTIPVVVPPHSIAAKFDAIVRPLFRKRWDNTIQNRALITLRDTLIPKLISGEYRLEDPEQMISSSLGHAAVE